MCQTILQYYIPCEHTNVAFIPCDDPAWYASDRPGWEPMASRSHLRAMGQAHSYERVCPGCLKRKWDIEWGEGYYNGVDAWVDLDAITVKVGRAGLVLPSEKDTWVVHTPEPESDYGIPVLEELAVVDKRPRPLSPVEPCPLEPLIDLDDVVSYCQTRVTQSHRWFPNLIDVDLETINRIISDRFKGDLGGNFSISFLYESVSPAAELLYLLVTRFDGKGRKVLDAVATGLVQLTRLNTQRREQRTPQNPTDSPETPVIDMVRDRDLLKAQRAFEWLAVLLYEHKKAYERYLQASRKHQSIDYVKLQYVMYMAWESYKNVTYRASRATVMRMIAEWLDPGRMATRQVRSIDDDDVLRIPETLASIMALAPELSARNAEVKASERPGEESDQSEPDFNLDIRSYCNDPTHTGRKTLNRPVKYLLDSRHHGPFPFPASKTSDPPTMNTQDILVHFLGCGHYNKVYVEKLTLTDQGDVVAQCGCSKFSDRLVRSQKARSLGSCLRCRWSAEIAVITNDYDGQVLNDWRKSRFQRQVELVTDKTVIGRWPFNARDGDIPEFR